MSSISPDAIRKARRHLAKCDPVIKTVMANVGNCTLKPQREHYAMLVRSLLSQQISMAAARTIRGRLQAMLPGRRITAAAVAALTDEQLTQAGISRQKRGYLRDLTDSVISGRVSFRRLARASDEVIIAELTSVRGIGVWTAQMFLIFSLGRPDIFAPDDLGLRTAMLRLYDLPDDIRRTELDEFAARWAPYRTVASWYLWRHLDVT